MRGPLAIGVAGSVVELTLRGGGVEPGDMLQLWWENDVAPAPGDDDPVAAWATPLPHRPARRVRTTAGEVRRRLVDLGGADAGASAHDARALLARTPRLTPRFYTVSGVAPGGSGAGNGPGVEGVSESSDTGTAPVEVRLQVTRAAAWPERAAAYLHRVQPGDVVRGWVLRHPHRVDRSRPGLAVVTGSGAAGVFAALRAGAHGIRLVWGLGDKRLAPWVERELDAHLASGGLAEVALARSPQRVTDVLAPRLAEVRALVADGGWVYVSGNEAMADAVDALLHGALGAEQARAHAELRYIVSA